MHRGHKKNFRQQLGHQLHNQQIGGGRLETADPAPTDQSIPPTD